MIYSDYHVHTVFCDGKDTPEQMVRMAMERKFLALGFSAHSRTEFDLAWCMKNVEGYKQEIRRLAEKYMSYLDIYCGVEQDYWSEASTAGFDYVIGSVHYVQKDGTFYSVDESAEEQLGHIKDHWQGDYDAFAEDYFALVGDVAEKMAPDIIGHFDLVSKFSEANGFGQSNRYLDAAEKAIDRLIPYDIPFEINVGAIVRGLKTVAYPSRELLERIRAKGGRIVISGDCHSAQTLGYGLEEACRYAQSAGFTEHYVLQTDGGWDPVPLG